MSGDLATLGIAVDSSGAIKAANDLNTLSTAAAKTEASTTRLSGAMTRVNTTMSGGSQNVKMVAMQMSQVAQQTMATGNFMQALAIQLPDMAMGLGAVGIAAGVLAAILLPMVDGGKYLAGAMEWVAGVLPQVAEGFVIVGAAAAVAFAPAIIAGAIGLATAIGTGLVGALSAVAGLIAVIGAIPLAFVAAVGALYIFRDEISQALGVDIVGAAKTGANLIIGSFVAAFEDIKFVWNQFPNILGAAVIGAANIVIQATVDMVQKAIDLINGMISSVNSILPEGMTIGTVGNLSSQKAAIANPYADALQAGLSERNAAVQQALNTDYIGAIGDGIAKGADFASGKLKELAKAITTVDEKTKKKGASGKTEAEKYSDIVAGADRKIASLRAEYDALGMTEQAASALKHTQDLLNEANQKGVTLSAAQTAELKMKAEEMARLEENIRAYKAAQDLATSSTAGFLSTLRQGLVNGEGWWKSMGNAALSVLDKIAGAIETQIANQLVSSGLGGLFGGLFGGGFNPVGKVGLFANGTSYAPGGMAIVGEQGPELVNLSRGAQVIPNHRLAANSNGQDVKVMIGFDESANGLFAYVEKTAASTSAKVTRAGLDAFSRDVLPRRINEVATNRRKVGK